MKETKYVEIAADLLHETEMAYLISDDGERKIWIPKSQLEDDPQDEGGGIYIFSIAEWLADREGLI